MDENSLFYNILLHTIALLITGIIVFAFALVMTRYVFQISWPWLHTAIKVCATWLVFLGAYVGLASDSHYKIDLLSSKLSPKAQKLHKLLIEIIILISLVFLCLAGWRAISIGLARKDPATGISMIYIYSSVIISGAIMFIYKITIIFKLLFS